MKRNIQLRTLPIILQLFLIVVAIVQLYPLFWLVTTSFKSNLEIMGANPLGLPHSWKWSNYEYALFGTQLARNFLNSLTYTAVAVIVSSLLSAMVSFAVMRMKWKLSKWVVIFFMLGLMIPVHATLLPLFLMLKHTSLLDTPWALIIPYTAAALPTTIFILNGFFAALPRELEEAGVVDGCSIYGVFFRIMLPLTKPALVTTAIFTLLNTWNELMFAITFINKPELMTLTVGIQSLQGVYSAEYGAIAAGMVLATAPVLIAYIFLSGQVQSSIIAGAIKG